MKASSVIVILIQFGLSISGFAADEGGTVENGGDTVYCRFRDPEPTPPGTMPIPPPDFVHDWSLYSRDYVTSLAAGAQQGDFEMPASWEASRRRILNALQATSSRLASSFTEFSNSIPPLVSREGGIGIPRRWIESRPRLIREVNQGRFPRNCLYFIAGETDGTRYIVAMRAYERSVLRVAQSGNGISYKFSPAALEKLQRNSALQLSFLYVHEWLWDFTRSPEVNRRVNAFLHSRAIDYMSPEQIRARLKQLGLKLPPR